MATTAVSTRAVRRVVLTVCVSGIAGMIVASVNDNNGAALTFGLVTTVAVVCLVVATAVTRPVGAGAVGPDAPAPVDEAQAARVEELVTRLVASGTDEQAVRSLVREAVRLGRSARS
ncbi:MAG: hypothetical protein ACR2KK_05370 [Acidimicrobiales bacterium]